jgi:phosphoribosylanthranilate isomerase
MMNKVSLKICGITNSQSVKMAYKNKIKSLGFASNNLNGPNTASDKKIQILIKECKNYKIDSVLLTRYISLDKLIKQIDFIKPKTISCSYHFSKHELQVLRKIFKKLKIGIAVNPENFNIAYLKDIKKIINVIYYDLNVYKTKSIKTYALKKCLTQIQSIKNLSIPLYIGGGINEQKATEVIKLLKPDGIDVSRGLKNSRNIISSRKLKKFLQQISVA